MSITVGKVYITKQNPFFALIPLPYCPVSVAHYLVRVNFFRDCSVYESYAQNLNIIT